MSGPNSVRSARARALLFVFGGWGWLGYRGQAGPSKLDFTTAEQTVLGGECMKWTNPAGFAAPQLVLKWFKPAGYITAETHIDTYHEEKSTTGVWSSHTVAQRNHNIAAGADNKKHWVNNIVVRCWDFRQLTTSPAFFMEILQNMASAYSSVGLFVALAVISIDRDNIIRQTNCLDLKIQQH